MSETPTPRTDAAESDGWDGTQTLTPSNFARTLERELTATSARIAKLEGDRDDANSEVTLLLAKLTASQLKVARLREALGHIIEYWNHDRNDGAMHDALYHIIETAEDALSTPAGNGGGGVSENYKFRKFTDGWWSVIFYISLNSWGKWRGPFDTKAEAEIDCVNASRGRYKLP